MRNVAAAVVGSFASFCTVEALDADGEIRSVAAAHRNSSLVPLIEQAAEMRNHRPDHPIYRAIHKGETTLIEDLPPTWWDTFGQRDELGSRMDDLDMRSVIYVPIRSQQSGTIRGALACILAGSDPRVRYTTEDVRFAEEVAVRAGLAFDHARAYERELRIAVTLQGASLPKTLPTIDHLYLSADYRPGKSEATIGGDWYDAFALDDGRVAITVGDVLGNGLAAAVIMGRLRQAMRAVALLLPEPNAMLDAADRTVKAESDDQYATALAGVFDPRTHQFTFASAGHPTPVLRHPDGRIEEFNAPGVMLGLRRGTSLQTMTIDLAPGSTVVFFTDGLIEATRDIDEGYRRLHAAMSDAAVAGAENPAHALCEHVLMGRPATDDIAILVAEVGPSKRFDERLRTSAAVAAERDMVTIAGSAT
jgi:serine phosphatase RsbU (regulator of sigma subunit)